MLYLFSFSKSQKVLVYNSTNKIIFYIVKFKFFSNHKKQFWNFYIFHYIKTSIEDFIIFGINFSEFYLFTYQNYIIDMQYKLE